MAIIILIFLLMFFMHMILWPNQQLLTEVCLGFHSIFSSKEAINDNFGGKLGLSSNEGSSLDIMLQAQADTANTAKAVMKNRGLFFYCYLQARLLRLRICKDASTFEVDLETSVGIEHSILDNNRALTPKLYYIKSTLSSLSILTKSAGLQHPSSYLSHLFNKSFFFVNSGKDIGCIEVQTT